MRKNWPSLLFLCLGLLGCGKDLLGIPDEHKPPFEISFLDVCLDDGYGSAVSGLTFTAPLLYSTDPENCNARCVYTTELTVPRCLGDNDRYIASLVMKPTDDPGLIQFWECCPPSAKKVAISPIVSGHYINQNCEPINFHPVPLKDPDDPNAPLCYGVGGSF